MVKWFVRLSAEKKDLFILSVFYVFVFLCLTPCFFLKHSEWPWGWLLGSAVSVFSYWSISQMPGMLLNRDPSAKKSVKAVVFALLRFALLASALFIGAICTFRSEWFNGWNLINFFAVMLSYIPMPILLVVSSLIKAKHTPEIHDCPSSEDSSEDKK
jgi:hypothetical protein